MEESLALIIIYSMAEYSEAMQSGRHSKYDLAPDYMSPLFCHTRN